MPPPDKEAIAVEELAGRAARLRRTILVPSILFGLMAAIAGYIAVREVQLSILGAHMPWLSGVIGCFPPFGAALRVGQRVANGAVKTRAPAWVAEQIAKHGLPAGSLDDFLAVL